MTHVAATHCWQLFHGASEAEVEAVCAALRRSTLVGVHLDYVGLTRQHRDALRAAAAAAPRLRDVSITETGADE